MSKDQKFLCVKRRHWKLYKLTWSDRDLEITTAIATYGISEIVLFFCRLWTSMRNVRLENLGASIGDNAHTLPTPNYWGCRECVPLSPVFGVYYVPCFDVYVVELSISLYMSTAV